MKKKILSLCVAFSCAVGSFGALADTAYDVSAQSSVTETKNVVSLPQETGTFGYSFKEYTKQYSDFIITPQTDNTGMRISFSATSEWHTLTMKIIDYITEETIYSKTMASYEDAEHEVYVNSGYFEKGKEYYIELSEPSVIGASGEVTVMGPAPSKGTRYVTRAAFSHYLVEFLEDKGVKKVIDEEDMFGDVPLDSLYSEDIAKLKNLNVIKGDGDDNFRPNYNITYCEAAVMISRIFAADKTIVGEYGTYPEGYINLAKEKAKWDFDKDINEAVTLSDAYTMINNLADTFKVYDIIEDFGCDTYNGSVYVKQYPQDWQKSYEDIGEKVMYSYDNENWNTLYEDIDGKRVYYGLPEDLGIEGARYAWEYGCFVSAPAGSEKKFYSYDFINWFEGTPKEAEVSDEAYSIPLDTDEFPLGIEKQNVVLYEDGLYFAWYEYENTSYDVPGAILADTKSNMIWVSKDAKNWIGITIPSRMNFYTSIGLQRRGNALIIDGATDFTAEDTAYLDALESGAKEAGAVYTRPRYKIERFVLRFSEINKLFE